MMALSVSISIPIPSHMSALNSAKSSTRTPTTLAIGGVGGGRGFKSGLPSLAGPWTMQTTQFSFNLKQVQLPTRRRGRGPGHCGVTCMASYEAGIGVMGTKLGMMTYFEPGGKYVPVTVVGFREGNIVTQIKTEATDGYDAVQIGYRRIRDRKLTKPELGHLNKAGAIPMRHLQEFKLTSVEGFEPNQRLEFDKIFKEGDLVDVSGKSIGKGFQGGIKRHNFKRGPMTHGSKSHRQLGSIGAGTTPGHVYKGKKMPGRMGGTKTKIRKLQIVKIDTELDIDDKGAVPGKPGNLLRITPAKIVGKNIPKTRFFFILKNEQEAKFLATTLDH